MVGVQVEVQLLMTSLPGKDDSGHQSDWVLASEDLGGSPGDRRVVVHRWSGPVGTSKGLRIVVRTTPLS